MGTVPTKEAIIGQFINGRNATDDFLQLADNHGGNVFAWIDSAGVLRGTFASGLPGGSNTDVQFNNNGVLGGDNGFTYDPIVPSVALTNLIAATSGANNNSPSFILSGTYWTGAASAKNSWTLQDVISAGTNPQTFLTLTHTGSVGGGIFHVTSGLNVDQNVAMNGALNVLGAITAGPVSGNPAFVARGNSVATSLVNFSSGTIQLDGSYWDGAAAQVDSWVIKEVLAAGTNPTSTLSITQVGSPGGALVQLTGIAVTMGSLIAANITTGGPIELSAAAATAISNVNSYYLKFDASYWDGAASQTDVISIRNVMGTGVNPIGSLEFTHTGTPSGSNVNFTGMGLVLSHDIQCGGQYVAAGGLTVGGDVLLYGNTPATNILNVSFGKTNFQGNYWDGAASQLDSWTITPSLGAGTNPTSTLTIAHSGTPGAALLTITPNATFAGVLTGATLIESATHTPATAGDTGTTGQIAWDASFIYICTATNTWKRVGIASW